jgi:hypothetical protein
MDTQTHITLFTLDVYLHLRHFLDWQEEVVVRCKQAPPQVNPSLCVGVVNGGASWPTVAALLRLHTFLIRFRGNSKTWFGHRTDRVQVFPDLKMQTPLMSQPMLRFMSRLCMCHNEDHTRR